MLAIGTINTLNHMSKSTDTNTATYIFYQLVHPLQNAGYDPIFFGYGKCMAEIS